jgi:hypothetical protein
MVVVVLEKVVEAYISELQRASLLAIHRVKNHSQLHRLEWRYPPEVESGKHLPTRNDYDQKYSYS